MSDSDEIEFTREDVVTLLLEVMDCTYVQATRDRPMTDAEKKVIDDIRTALAAPEPGPEPATDVQLLAAYRQRGCGFYIEFKEIWQVAERFHGITKEGKT